MRVSGKTAPVRRPPVCLPLIDAHGQQTRLDDVDDRHHRAQPSREQLSASYERFTIVLESLDASGVGGAAGQPGSCCLPTNSTANGSAHTGGHLQLVAQASVACRRATRSGDGR